MADVFFTEIIEKKLSNLTFDNVLIFDYEDISDYELISIISFFKDRNVVLPIENNFLRSRLTYKFGAHKNFKTVTFSTIPNFNFDLLLVKEVNASIFSLMTKLPHLKAIISKNVINDVVSKNFEDDWMKFGFHIMVFHKNVDILDSYFTHSNDIDEFKEKYTFASSLKNTTNENNVEVKADPIINEENNKVNETISTDLTVKKSIDKSIEVSAEEKVFTFFSVNYNTSKLINCLIKSIHKFVKSIKYKIVIFDNSDSEKLTLDEDWDDVKVIDNSHGEVIDYSVKIPEICDMKRAADFANFISAKHVLAIEYGINSDEVTNDIILCDSDIIIFKDLDFIDTSYLAIGSNTDSMKPDRSHRLLPFLCYINKKLMKKFNIAYFDKYRFHGCKIKDGRTRAGLDTGESFLNDIIEKKAPLKLIDIDNWCIHFGGMSRDDKWKKTLGVNIDKIEKFIEFDKKNDFEFTRDIILKYFYDEINENELTKYISIPNLKYVIRFGQEKNISNIYNYIEEKYTLPKTKNKFVIYTCITNGYDKIYEQEFYDFENFDYVCLTDSDIKSDNWNVIRIDDIKDNLDIKDSTKLARFCKTHPHLFFKNYVKSIWIDGNIQILSKNLVRDYTNLLGSNDYFLTSGHPKLKNVYEEIKACIGLRKDSIENLNRARTLLETEHFKNDGQHIQTNIILRRHNNKKCIELMERWWEMINEYTKRDQVSFNYVFWKYDGKFMLLPWDFVSTNLFTTTYAHAKKS